MYTDSAKQALGLPQDIEVASDWSEWAPGVWTLCDGKYTPITAVHHHPPGQHPPGAPIRADLYAAEAVTANGSRWRGYLPNRSKR